ncbi:hypothetical protein [Burkholderia sp. Ed8]|uniref:hypothetical protein n=1 Tax=Burkholderia sp. Ed8 TaxID=3112957 RepID=UPI00345D2B52
MDRLIAANSVPQAQADTAPATGTPQFATDGNPASNVPATRWPSYAFNAIQEELIAILRMAGITPDRTNNAQIAAAIQALITQSAPVVGSMRNLAMSIPTASSSATLTADELVVGTALGSKKYVLGSFSKSINIGNTGPGGMDTGSAPVSGFVALYAIYSPAKAAQHASDPITYPDDGIALLATDATTTIAPNVYAGANMPPGFSGSALVSVVPTNAGRQFAQITQRNRMISVVNRPIIATSSGSSTPQAYTTTAFPKNAVRVKGYSSFTTGVASTVNAGIYADAAGSDQSTVGGTFTGAQGIAGSFDVLIGQPQTIYYTLTSSSGAPSWGANCERYEI